MFKSVAHVGFEARPGPRALAAVVHDWRDALAVTWRPADGDELELALDATGAAGARSWGARAATARSRQAHR